MACTIDIAEVGQVAARVTRTETGGFAIALVPEEPQRLAILAKLHTRSGASGTTRTDVGGLLSGLAMRAARGLED